MIGVLLTLIFYIIAFGLLWWLVQYLLGLFPLPDPLPRVIQAILAVILVVMLIGVLFSIGGYDTGIPRLRLG